MERGKGCCSARPGIHHSLSAKSILTNIIFSAALQPGQEEGLRRVGSVFPTVFLLHRDQLADMLGVIAFVPQGAPQDLARRPEFPIHADHFLDPLQF